MNIVDGIIHKLSSLMYVKPLLIDENDNDKVLNKQPNIFSDITEGEIKFLCTTVNPVFLKDPPLLELKSPINICGDLHGQLYDLLRIFNIIGIPPNANYLFLGDYVDRGFHSIETISLLFAFKIKYPNNFFILRGNHETASICRDYGLYEDCKSRFSTHLWKILTDSFNYMPLAAVVNDKIFCCHGGISPELENIKDINNWQRPSELPDVGVFCDLLWADPSDDTADYIYNADRKTSYCFGANAVDNFLKKNNLGMICRAHECVDDGYRFFFDRKLISIFSAPLYSKGEYSNSGAVLRVNRQGECEIEVIKPIIS